MLDGIFGAYAISVAAMLFCAAVIWTIVALVTHLDHADQARLGVEEKPVE